LLCDISLVLPAWIRRPAHACSRAWHLMDKGRRGELFILLKGLVFVRWKIDLVLGPERTGSGKPDRKATSLAG